VRRSIVRRIGLELRGLDPGSFVRAPGSEKDAPGLDPLTEEVQCLEGRPDSKRRTRCVELRSKILGPPQEGADVLKGEVADRSAMEVMALRSRLDQAHCGPRAHDGHRETGEAGTRSEVDEGRAGVREKPRYRDGI
jgi:hypothetical protein